MIEITYTVECLPEEDVPFEGNCLVSGNDAADREAEQWIRDQLDRGNEWAWCCIKVTATLTVDGVDFAGTDYLGGCSYKSRADFMIEEGYYPDMRASALADLEAALSRAVGDGAAAAKGLRYLEAL